MTTIRSGAPVTVRSTTTAAPAAPAAPQKPASGPAGHSTASSFSPASSSSASTGSSTSVGPETTKAAIDILGKTSGGDALKKLLSQPSLPRGDIDKAIEEFEKIKGSLSPADAKTVEDAIQFESALTGTIELGRMMMKNMMAQMEAKAKEYRDEMSKG